MKFSPEKPCSSQTFSIAIFMKEYILFKETIYTFEIILVVITIS